MAFMAKVTIHNPRGDFTVEDITFEQAKELVGVNGYGAPELVRVVKEPNFRGFLNGLSDRGQKFIKALLDSPHGIEAYRLAELLGFNEPRQIGGLTGGGIAKIAKRNGVKITDVYRSKVTFPDGKRVVMFYPGKAVLAMDKEKPA
jgi:hypothetical protein